MRSAPRPAAKPPPLPQPPLPQPPLPQPPLPLPRLPLADLALSEPVLDRSAAERAEAAALAAAWADPATRVVTVDQAKVAVTGGELLARSPADAPAGERYFLGRHHGVAWFAVGQPTDAISTPGTGWLSVRDLAAGLDELTGAVIVQAAALAQWHHRHPRCARCGGPTAATQAGHQRDCTGCGAEHFPRTDPAIIVLVRDHDDRALLARSASWPVGRFSTLAGFVEPGESLEAAVRREVVEETGIELGSRIAYAGSQPWPFPSSLMVGFFADAATTTITIDGDEICEAYWFSRDDYGEQVSAGEVLASTSISISRRLIEAWYGDRLPIPAQH